MSHLNTVVRSISGTGDTRIIILMKFLQQQMPYSNTVVHSNGGAGDANNGSVGAGGDRMKCQ